MRLRYPELLRRSLRLVALFINGKEIPVRDGEAGPNTQKLCAALQDIQKGVAPDTHHWLTLV